MTKTKEMIGSLAVCDVNSLRCAPDEFCGMYCAVCSMLSCQSSTYALSVCRIVVGSLCGHCLGRQHECVNTVSCHVTSVEWGDRLTRAVHFFHFWRIHSDEWCSSAASATLMSERCKKCVHGIRVMLMCWTNSFHFQTKTLTKRTHRLKRNFRSTIFHCTRPHLCQTAICERWFVERILLYFRTIRD